MSYRLLRTVIRRGCRAAAAAMLLCTLAATGDAGPAHAERLVLSVSQPQVRITSSFAGAEVVVFGVAEAEGEPLSGTPDVVMTVQGPGESFTTWRKARVLGLWINTDSRAFVEAPSFLYVAASRPVEEMASAETLRRLQIGLARNILLQRVGPDFADVVPSDPFRSAFLRIQEAHGYYGEVPHGVTFIAPRVFRSEIRIPGTAPLGRYTVNVKLLRSGNLTAETAASFEVVKTGFEQRIAEFSQAHALLYGLAVAFGSLVVGFVGNLLFRRE